MQDNSPWLCRVCCGVALAASAGCAGSSSEPSASAHNVAVNHERGHEKQWSGVHFVEGTVVERTPWPSPAGAGFDSERVWSGFDDWEPAVAADPFEPFVYQMVTRFQGPLSEVVFRRSIDGGATWEADRAIHPSPVGQADPIIEVDDNGVVYAGWLQNWATVISRSFDNGVTWTQPQPVAPNLQWTDFPRMAVSPDGFDVYVALNRSDSFVIASHDGGATFAPAVQTNNDNRYWFHPSMAVAPNGDVVVAAIDYNVITYHDNAGINVLHSDDGGASWDTITIDISRDPPPCPGVPGCYYGFFGPTAGLAINADGRMLIAYSANNQPEAPNQIRVRMSNDGVNWGPRRRVSHGNPSANNAFPVAVAGPEPGEFRVIWQGDRGTPGTWNTWYRRTTDGGATWGPIRRLSDLFDGAPYKEPQGYHFTYGDYFEADITADGLIHIIWGEGSSYNGPGGVWYTRGE